MLFERQRLLLTLLDALGGRVSRIDFQKLLFLYTQQETEPTYEFVPYRFGCYSFTSAADRRRLAAKGLIDPHEHDWSLTVEGRKVARQRPVAPLQVGAFCREHRGLRGNELVAEVYRQAPYYAIHSEIVEKVLSNPAEQASVQKARPAKASASLLTIGYEGKSLEAYLNQLIRAGVTVLCDVRRNPLSRKFGFSKSNLSKACEGVGIRYEHLPELGIASENRRGLKSQEDYDTLFEDYERSSLPHQSEALSRISGWIAKGEAVALTCFEKHPHQCHRHCVAEALEAEAKNKWTAMHL